MSVELVIVITCDYCQDQDGPVMFTSRSAVYEVAADDARAGGWLDDGGRDWWCPACQDLPERM